MVNEFTCDVGVFWKSGLPGLGVLDALATGLEVGLFDTGLLTKDFSSALPLLSFANALSLQGVSCNRRDSFSQKEIYLSKLVINLDGLIQIF